MSQFNKQVGYLLKVIFKYMNQSILTANLALNNAYNHFRNGKLETALEQYQKALKSTFPEDLKANIIATMAVIEQSLGRQQKAIELLTKVVGSKHTKNNSVVLLRIYSNLTMMEIFEERYTKALEYFEKIMTIIEKEKNMDHKKHLLRFTTYLFFRVNNLEDISQQIQNMDFSGMRLEEVYTMSLMAFNSEVCQLECQQKIQKLCYDHYLKNKRYDLALFSLRSLIYFTKNMVNRQFYERQIANLIMMGYFDDSIDFNNFEPFEIIQAIMEQFVIFRNQIKEQTRKQQMQNSQLILENKIEPTDCQVIVQWKYSIAAMIKELLKAKDIQKDSKKSIIGMLEGAAKEENMLVIRSMIKNSYFSKHYERTQKTFKSFTEILSTIIKRPFKKGFQKIKSYDLALKTTKTSNSLKGSVEQKGRASIKIDRSKSFTKLKEDKENCPPTLGISIVSIASSKVSKDHTRKKIFGQQSVQLAQKRLQKMVKFCEYGSFLNKRNFNSDGGEFKFVKINQAFIKWGKDPQKIETHCQIYPLKDIRSIIYGRVTPNLNESCNKMLNYSNCFSLLLQKRTLDFYCKSYEQLESWVCGLTQVIKKSGNRTVGYTPGKLRWKKMFAILKQNFIEPLKIAQRNKYYYENAYALKLFAKNGYKLPSRAADRR